MKMHCRSIRPVLSALGGAFLLAFLTAAPVHPQSNRERRFAARVSPDQLQRVVRQLVHFGNRLGGTGSGDRSAASVQRALRSFGLKTTVEEDDALPVYTIDDWSLTVQEPRRLRGLIQYAALAGFSPTTPVHSARLVLLPSADDVGSVRVDSQAVLFDGEVTESLCSDLANAGARALVAYRTLPSAAYTQGAMITMLPARTDNPLPVFDISNTAGERLRKELGAHTPVRIRFSAHTRFATGRPRTVIGTVRGTSGREMIVCAHGDAESGGPGADDNASGVAAVLELARTLGGMVNRRELPRPAVTIRFVVWGSEIHSTRSYIRRHADEMDSLVGVINFDEVGYGKTRNCLYAEGNDVEVNRDLLTTFQQVFEAYAGKPGFWKEATTNPSQGGTDSYVFQGREMRRLGVHAEEMPSITVFTDAWNTVRSLPQTRGWRSPVWHGHPDSVAIDYSPYYHSTLDIPRLTTDKEPSNMLWAVKATGCVLLRTAWAAPTER